jgi:LPXTG-motif cell wall-anchored protein
VAPTLAHTGADGLGGIAAASAGLLLGGAVLYRRSRAGRTSHAAALAGAGAAAGAAA